jgi:hypothetical protein
MTLTTFTRTKQDAIARRIADLQEEWVALNARLTAELNTDSQIRIERQMALKDSEIARLERELNALGLAEGSYDSFHDEWQRRIPELDFKRAIGIFNTVLDDLEDSEGAALFLLQDALSMEGHSCVARMRNLLQQKTIALRSHEIEFVPTDRLSPLDLLRRIGARVGVEIPPAEADAGALRQHTRAILQKIRGSLQSGCIVFFTLTVWDSLSFRDPFVSWLVGEFWAAIVEEIRAVGRQHPMVKFILVIIVNTPLVPGALPELHICKRRRFESHKILELPLQKWTREELKRWLLIYSGLTGAPVGLDAEAIDHLSETIYLSSRGGEPSRVAQALMQLLKRYFT